MYNSTVYYSARVTCTLKNDQIKKMKMQKEQSRHLYIIATLINLQLFLFNGFLHYCA